MDWVSVWKEEVVILVGLEAGPWGCAVRGG